MAADAFPLAGVAFDGQFQYQVFCGVRVDRQAQFGHVGTAFEAAFIVGHPGHPVMALGLAAEIVFVVQAAEGFEIFGGFITQPCPGPGQVGIDPVKRDFYPVIPQGGYQEERQTEKLNGSSLIEAQKHNEEESIRSALRTTSGNRSLAARLLGISPQSLYYKIKKHRIIIADYIPVKIQARPEA